MYGCGCDSCTLPPFKGCISVFTPKPVLYSRVACPSCGGVTVEVAPKTRRLGRDDRRHVGTPYVVVTRHQFWCDGCEVMTWRKHR